MTSVVPFFCYEGAMIDPVEHNFNVYHSHTTAYPFTLYDDEALTTETDLSGYTVTALAKISYNATTSVNLNPTIDGNVVYLNLTPAQAQTMVVLPNNATAKYYYDIKLTKTLDGTVWNLARGVITVYPKVT